MQRDAAPAPVSVADERWRAALQQVVDDPAALLLHAQPIVELTSGQIAGFELLSRFTGPWVAPPDQWFAAAEQWGFNATLQARVLSGGIAARAALPPDTFLTVNLDPHLLTEPEVVAVLSGVTDLSRLVLELTEHTHLGEEPTVTALLAHVRAAGALLAMDDAGTGYAGLSTLLTLRPDIVKLDRELIAGIDEDPVKRALVEVLGDLAGRMDAWILAEGIETAAELDTLIGLGVPLGQGFFLARPAPAMATEIDTALVAHIRRTAARTSLRSHVASLVRAATIGTREDDDDVLLGADGRPVRVRSAGRQPLAGPGAWSPAMTVGPSAALTDVARRAMTREAAHRFAPLVCTDGRGTVLGLIHVDDLLLALCSLREE